MKKFIFLPLTLMALVSFAFIKPVQEISLEEALAKRLIKAKIHGIDMNHFSDLQAITGNNLEIELSNISAAPISVKIPAGFLFISEEDPFQNMIVPETRLFAVAAGEERSYSFAGKCIQMHDMGPGEGTQYKPGGSAEGALLKLAQYSDQYRLGAKPEIQQAFWVLSDNNPIYYLDENKEVQKYVSLISGKPIEERPAEFRNYSPPVVRSWTVKNTLEFGLNTPSKVSLIIKDAEGKVIKTFLDNEEKKPGKHTLRFTWTWKEGKYLMQLLVDGKVKAEKPIELKPETN